MSREEKWEQWQQKRRKSLGFTYRHFTELYCKSGPTLYSDDSGLLDVLSFLAGPLGDKVARRRLGAHPVVENPSIIRNTYSTPRPELCAAQMSRISIFQAGGRRFLRDLLSTAHLKSLSAEHSHCLA